MLKNLFLILLIFFGVIFFGYSATIVVTDDIGIHKWINGTFDGIESNNINISSSNLTFFSNQEFPENNVENDWINMSNNQLLIHLNENQGTIYDKSSNGFTSASAGSGVDYFKKGKLGQSMYFDGTSGAYVRFNDNANFDITGPMTISAWARPEKLGSTQTIVGKHDSGGYALRFDSGNRFDFLLYIGGAYRAADSNLAYNIDKWNHVVGVYNGTQIMIYVDGVLQNDIITISGPSTATNQPVLIGCNPNGGSCGAEYFNGNIDEVAMWDRALSSEEILNIYDIQKINFEIENYYYSDIFDLGSRKSFVNVSFIDFPYGICLPDNQNTETEFNSGNIDMADNVLLLHLDEIDGNVIDSSGNNYHGTLNGGGVQNVEGVFNNAYAFDGVDDYISLPIFDINDNFSMSVWTNVDPSKNSQAFISKHDSSGNNEFIFGYYGFDIQVRIGDDYHEGGNLNSGWNNFIVNAEQISSTTTNVTVFQNGNILWNYVINNVTSSAITNTFGWSVGQEYDSGPTTGDFTDGLIDEVAIWNRTLTDLEIETIYNRGTFRKDIFVRSCNDNLCENEIWETSSQDNFDLDNLNENQYLQFMVDLQTFNLNYTPHLNFINLVYSDVGLISEPSLINITDDSNYYRWIDGSFDGLMSSGDNLSLKNLENNTKWELPNGGTSTGWVDMTDNILLLHLNEASGDIYDSSGNGNVGDGNVLTYNKETPLNKGVYIEDTTSSYIEFDDAPFDVTGAMTMMVWVKPDGNDGYIIGKLEGGGYGLKIGSGGDFLSSHYISGSYRTTNSNNIYNFNKWHHVVSVYNTTHAMLYVDGVLQNEVIPITGLITETNQPLIIGCNPNSGGCDANYFKGALDEVAIWERALSTDEIKLIYDRQKNKVLEGVYESQIFDLNSISSINTFNINDFPYGKELPSNNLIEENYYDGNINMTDNLFLFHFDESANPIVDFSGNNHDGTYTGSNFLQSGILNYSLNFDGNDYIDVGDFDIGNDVTISTWVYLDDMSSSQVFLSKHDSGGNNILIFGCGYTDNKFHLNLRGSAYNVVSSILGWQHITMRFEWLGSLSTNVSTYINGKYVYSQVLPKEFGNVLGKEWTIGQEWDGGTRGDYFKGKLDELSMWDRTLSDEEIYNIYKRTALKMNVDIRDCDDSNCINDDWDDITCYDNTCDISSINESSYIQFRVNMGSSISGLTPNLDFISFFSNNSNEVISQVENLGYTFPTPFHNAKISYDIINFKVLGSDLINVNISINNNISSMICYLSYCTYEYNISGFSQIFTTTFNITDGNVILETRTFTSYPSSNKTSNKVPALGLFSYFILLFLVIFFEWKLKIKNS